MKQHLKTIEETIELFGDKAFYTISFDEYGVAFQGKFHSGIIQRCQQLGYTFEIHGATGFISLTKEQIKITLTE